MYVKQVPFLGCSHVIDFIDKTLSVEDREEIKALGNESSTELLNKSLDCSTESYILYSDQLPLAAFGFTTNFVGNAIVWMLSTNRVHQFKIGTFKVAQTFIHYVLTSHPIAYNMIWVENIHRIKWLKSLGFSFIEPPAIQTKTNERFILFYKKR